MHLGQPSGLARDVRGGRARLDSHEKLVAIGALAVALLLRLAVIAATPDFHTHYDAGDFDRHAVSIAEGHGYPVSVVAPAGGPTALRPPLYPLVLAALYRVVGPSHRHARWLAGRISGALTGTAVVALIGLVAARLWGRRTALVALVLAALCFPLAVWGDALVADGLFAALELAAILAVLVWRSDGKRRWLVAAGLLAGAGALTRDNGLLLVLPLLGGVVAHRRGGRRLLAPAIVVAATVITVSPWLVRNVVVMHEPTLSTASGYVIAGTYNEASRHDRRYPALFRLHNAADDRLIRGMGEARADRRLLRAGLDDALAHPAYVGEVVLRSTQRLFDLDPRVSTLDVPEAGGGPLLAAAMRAASYPFLVLALAGLAAGALRRGPRFVWWVPALLVVTTVVVTGFPRYRVSIDPFIVLLAAYGVRSTWDGATRRRRRQHPRAA